MKKLFTLLLIAFMASNAFAQLQDTILTSKLEKIPCKIILITETIVVYRDAVGAEKYMNLSQVKFNWIAFGNSVDRFKPSMTPDDVIYPENQIRIAGVFKRKASSNIISGVALSIGGSIIGALGAGFLGGTGGTVMGIMGGVAGLTGFGVAISGVVKLGKAGAHQERAMYPPAVNFGE